MHCPTLNDLPSPPPNKTGWPWTEPGPQLPNTMPDGSPWPCVSIVTPSYNQGQFIEETIRSVLLQGYPALEYIIIDGDSSDDSLEIIKKYAPWLTVWISEPDQGQAHAINKGFAQCTGELLGWINSDDLLLPQAVKCLAMAFQESPQAILAGDVIDLYDDGGYRQLLQQQNITFDTIVEPWRHNIRWHQPGICFPRLLYQQAGPLDESLQYAFTADWLCRALQIAPVQYIHMPIAQFRFHTRSKTMHSGAVGWFRENSTVTQRYWGKTSNFDVRLSQAHLKLHQAALHLRLHNWARIKGITCLRKAVWSEWRILTLRKFWLLCLKALAPRSVLEILQRLYQRLFRKSLWLTY